MTEPALLARARAWVASDPDPATRAEAERLIESGDAAELKRAFGARLHFGTAGLRGRIGPGPGQMNRALVRRVTAGLGDYLVEQVPDARVRGVVIGFDGRHGSREFAADAAGVLGDRGFQVHLFPEVVATPVLSYAARDLGCAAGIMVTASHNPPQDNGYKVYWANAAQIIPPHDTGISAAIDRITETPGVSGDHPPTHIDDALIERYHDDVQALRVHPEPGGELSIVYTAMHGVGTPFVEEALSRAGYTAVHRVDAQCTPDGDFPTVSFPNPEEPGALDLATARAEEVGAGLIVANDPDADRLAVAVPDGAGGWTQLTGNQIGCLLADDLLQNGDPEGARLVATTVVSSPMLAQIAALHGADYAETLTGFKWLANRGAQYESEAGGRFVFGYEEALGYSAGGLVRDKDGVSAVLLLCDLAAACRRAGGSLVDRWRGLCARVGAVFDSSQKSLVLPGAEGQAQIAAIMARLRAEPPTEIAGTPVATLRDVQAGTATTLETGETARIDLPPTNLLAFDLADGARVLVRPSGTEPKLKFYFQARVPYADGGDWGAAVAAAAARLDALREDVVGRLG
jgi:phosphomannomutase